MVSDLITECKTIHCAIIFGGQLGVVGIITNMRLNLWGARGKNFLLSLYLTILYCENIKFLIKLACQMYTGHS